MPAGDRTFALIGVATAVIGALSAADAAPNPLAGAVTGVGFIGASLTFRQSIKDREVLRGITTAAVILAAAAIGAAAGEGHFVLATTATAVVLLVLEIRHLPLLRVLDARRWQDRFQDDVDIPDTTTGADPDDTPGT
ncbi:MAG TPA: MgtC/SapB family protein [Pseudonocardiaceae bacterium]